MQFVIVVLVAVVVVVVVVVASVEGSRMRGSAVAHVGCWNHEPWRQYRGLPACPEIPR